MIYTTLNRIRAHSPCRTGWEKLLRHLGKTQADDEPLALATVLDSNGAEDALWCLRAEPQHSAVWRLFAVRCARRVQHLMADPRSIAALDVAELHARGEATDAELDATYAAARDAARDDTFAAALAATYAAAWDAARGATYAATCAATLASPVWGVAMWEIGDDLRVVLTHYDAMPGRAAGQAEGEKR